MKIIGIMDSGSQLMVSVLKYIIKQYKNRAMR